MTKPVALPATEPALPRAPAVPALLLPAFSAALLRAKARGGPGDEPAVVPDGAPAPLQAATAPAPWSPQALPAAHPSHERRAVLAALPPAPAQWQLQVEGAGPVRSIDLQRAPDGAVHVTVTASAIERTLPTERLRQRLAARGGSLSWREEPDR